MIRLREATMLAFTKLRTRKVRLTITVIIAGLLFSALAAASIAARGTISSLSSFMEEGFGSRYIARTSPIVSGNNFMMNDGVIERALAIDKELTEKKKAEAKRLGLEYSSSTDMPPVSEYTLPDGTKMRGLNANNPASQQAIKEYLAAHPEPGLADLKRLAASYNPTAFYESYMLPGSINGELKVLKEGREDFTQKNDTWHGSIKGLDGFAMSWNLISNDLLTPFILPGQNLDLGADGSVPVVVPLSAAQEVLGFKELAPGASPKERLERVRDIRNSISSATFTACYRNSTSAELVGLAISAQQQIDQNKDNKDYRKPDLQYGLPAEPCGTGSVIRDVRTAAQKNIQSKQEQFDLAFGKKPAGQTTLSFRIVGIVPDMPDYGAAFSASQIISTLLASSLGSGWYSPLEQARQNPTINALFFEQDVLTPGGVGQSYHAEFATASQARAFMREQSCQPDFSGDKSDPLQQCVQDGKPFSIYPFGSNSLAVEDAKQLFGNMLGVAGLIVAVIACIIMMGTVGKMIADNRRETAVFRAIGAKKLDIAQIYLTYTVFISLLVVMFAVLVGVGVVMWADVRWADEITQQALLAYNVGDLSKQFSLFGFGWTDMLYLLGLAGAAGLLSASFPLIRSLRRNPIRDMRDDT